MTASGFGDLDGVAIDRAAVRLVGQGNIGRRLEADEAAVFVVYGHAGLPTIKSTEDGDLVRVHPFKPAYIAELTPALVKELGGKRSRASITDTVRATWELEQGIAQLPLDGPPEEEPDDGD